MIQRIVYLRCSCKNVSLVRFEYPPLASCTTTCVISLLSCNRAPLQHIVDKEAILQLMKNCPMCDRKCRCTKHSRGPYFIVYQSCYFCHYQRKWASQPEALNMNINKAHTGPKGKIQPKEKVCVNAKAKSSQLKKLKKLTWPIKDLRSPVLTVAYMNLGRRTSVRCALKWSIIRQLDLLNDDKQNYKEELPLSLLIELERSASWCQQCRTHSKKSADRQPWCWLTANCCPGVSGRSVNWEELLSSHNHLLFHFGMFRLTFIEAGSIFV